MLNVLEWFKVNGYHIIILSGVNTLRYMHILKELKKLSNGFGCFCCIFGDTYSKVV
jgi:hypothetical protein